MWWKILLEILVAFFLLLLGSPFWAMRKTRAHLNSLYADEAELRRLVEFHTPEKLIEEGRTIKPVFGSYLQNIFVFEKTHFETLKRTRNIILIATVLLMVISYFLGLPS